MSWLNAYTLHVFVNNSVDENWVEQVLGNIVRPIYEQFSEQINWMWATRYSDIYNPHSPPIGETLGNEYVRSSYYRFVAFRISVNAEYRQRVHDTALNLVKAEGYFASKWVDYDVVADLGSNRFIDSSADNNEPYRERDFCGYLLDAAIQFL